MEIEITNQKDNALFGRKDVTFVLRHDGAATPPRTEVRKLVATEIGAKTENVVVAGMDSTRGLAVTHGIARAYKDADTARKAEPSHFLKRNNLWVDAKKNEGGDE